MRMQKRFRLCCWLMLAQVLPTGAHQDLFTNFYLNMELNQTSLVYYVEGPSFLFPPTRDLAYNAPIVQQNRKDALQTYMKSISEVIIDGIPVNPIVRTVEYERSPASRHLAEQLDLLLVFFEVAYPIKSPPKQIRMHWKHYLPEPAYGWAEIADPDQEPDRLEVELEEYGRYNYFELTPREPEFIWHAVPAFTETNRLGAVSSVPPEIPGRFPTRPVGVALSFALLLLLAQTRGAGNATRLVLLSAGIGGTLWAFQAETPRKTPIPPAAQAVETFNELQRNIYRAFDYAKEEDVYDALAHSVSGPLLDRIYNDVYDSLILREEGGAVCRVEQVDILQSDFLGADESLGHPNYRVRSTWDVHGKVRHWGHTHGRSNRYTAEYQVQAEDARWFISAIRVLKQERLVKEAPGQAEDGTPWNKP